MSKKAPYFYLDANVLSSLVFEHADVRDSLRAKVERGDCYVLSSVELLEELAGAPREILKYHWSIVAWNVLDYAKAIFYAELKKGSALARGDAFWDTKEIADSRRCSFNSSFRAEVSVGVLAQKRDYEDEVSKLAIAHDRRLIELASRIGVDERPLRKEIDKMMVDVDSANDWFRCWFRDEIGDRRLSLQSMPRVRAWVAMQVARMWRRHSIKPANDKGNDLYDNSHFTLASMGDYFVTLDRSLRSAVSRIKWSPVQTLDIAAFEKLIAAR